MAKKKKLTKAERKEARLRKGKVYRLVLEGQKVEKAEDAVKDPYVLEFLGLKKLPEYSGSFFRPRNSNTYGSLTASSAFSTFCPSSTKR